LDTAYRNAYSFLLLRNSVYMGGLFFSYHYAVLDY